MSKEILKVRKQWLISPETKVHQPKKQKFIKEQDLHHFTGNLKDIDLEELEDDEYEDT